MPTGCVYATWVLAGPLPLNQYACRSVTTQSVCLPIFYHSFLHSCWCCVSLFTIPACMVSHYQPCLLLWSLIIAHAFRCDASLSAMPSGVLSHHRPRLLVWSLIINHAFGVVPHYRPCLLVSCHCKLHFYKLSADRRMATNMVLLVQRCHHIRHVC